MNEIELNDAIKNLHARLVNQVAVNERLAEKNIRLGRESNGHHFAGQAHAFRLAARQVDLLIAIEVDA